VQFLAASASDFKRGFIGQSGYIVRDTFSKARANAPSVLHIDLEHKAVARRNSLLPPQPAIGSHDEIASEMLVQMDGLRVNPCPVFVIAETEHIDGIDPTAVTRFEFRIEIPLADRFKGRRDFLDSQAAPAEPDSNFQFDPPADARKKLNMIADMLRNAEEFNRQRLPMARALLSGRWGAQQAEIARALADFAGVPLIEVCVNDLKGPLIDQSIAKLCDSFERARKQAPCVLFIDDIDSIAEAIENRLAECPGDIVLELFAQLRDGSANFVVLAATQDHKDLDPAVLARFAFKIDL
jgi:AAA+ superfamily predicted ATPase